MAIIGKMKKKEKHKENKLVHTIVTQTIGEWVSIQVCLIILTRPNTHQNAVSESTCMSNKLEGLEYKELHQP